MRARRSKTFWPALLVVLWYALAPLLAAAAPRARAVPPACKGPEQAHRCACRADPHAGGACCCKPGEAEGGCRMGPAPCGSQPDAALAPLWTFVNPLSQVTEAPVVRRTASAPAHPRAESPACLSGGAAPLTPPPQPRNIA